MPGNALTPQTGQTRVRTPVLQVVALVLCWALFLAYWAWADSQLPDRVATHFDGSGIPNGWMSRESNQLFMLAFGFGLPLFLACLFYVIRFLPSWMVNMPHRNYWLAPEHRRKSSNYLFRHGLWLCCLTILFIIGIQHSIVQANYLTPPRLSMQSLLYTLVPFLAGTLLWVGILLRHFRRVP